MPLDEIFYGIFIIQYFEQDDPDFYITKIKYIEENNVDDMELVFAEEEYTNGQLTKVKFSSSHLILKPAHTRAICLAKCHSCRFAQHIAPVCAQFL